MPDAIFSDAAAKLATQGVLGIAVLLLIGALIWSVRWGVAQAGGRLEDQREMGRQLMDVRKTISDLVDSTEARTDALDKSIDAQQATTRAIDACSRAVDASSAAEQLVRGEVQRMREYLVSKGMPV